MAENEIKIESLTEQPASQPAADQPTGKIKAAKFDWRALLKRNDSASEGIDVFKAIKYIYPLTIILIVLILFWVMSFLYNNVYLTMAQAEMVSTLKTKVIEESVDFSRFNSIVAKISRKKGLSSWPYLNYLSSPFAYGAKTAYPGALAPLPAALATSSPAIMPATTSATGAKATTTKSTSTKY